MPLDPGTRLGPYEVVCSIGAGGMGEVYRARDSKLNRDVALKVISETFVADADRLLRFKREAQVLASLNHPNIAAIYGFSRHLRDVLKAKGYEVRYGEGGGAHNEVEWRSTLADGLIALFGTSEPKTARRQ